MDARGEERLVRIDVADARDHARIHQELLDRHAPPARGAVQVGAREGLVEGLRPQAVEQRVVVGIAHPQHRPEPARVVQAHDVPAVQHEVHVVVASNGPAGRHYGEAARHAQVREQMAGTAVEQEVLAAATDAAHECSAQARGKVAGHGPAKARLSHHDVADATTHDAGDETQAGRLDFRKFRHRGWGVCGDYKATG